MNYNFHSLKTNGIQLRAVIEGEGPLCILVHGWPESWYSWRHQIPALVNAGYQVVVPDMRGYGGSDKPEKISDYSMVNMTDDIAGLIDTLGQSSAILIGHDWGGPIVWVTSIRYPQKVSAVAGLSVPHLRRSPNRNIKQIYEELYKDRFFYQLYFQQPGVAEKELEVDPLNSLRRIYYGSSGDCLESQRNLLMHKPVGAGLLDGSTDPDPFPDWLSEEDLSYFANEFKQSGFRGGINRYRNIQRDWRELPELTEKKIEQPAFFIAGSRDPVLNFIPGKQLHEVMDPMYCDLREKVIIPGGGHWIQQEKPAQTNEALLRFLKGLN